MGPARTFLERSWRIPLTVLSFGLFGLGSLVLGVLVFPAIRLLSRPERIGRRCRTAIHLSFRLFMGLLGTLRLVRYEVLGAERLRDVRGHLVVANHPSLIDVVVLVSCLPDVRCVVKEAVWRNPLMGPVVRSAGYVPSLDPHDVVDRVADLLRAGETVLLFPEGTRTRRGKPLTARRGAALILLRADCTAVPAHVVVRPAALGKEDSLRLLPPETIRFTINVGEPVHLPSVRIGDTERGRAVLGTRILERALRRHAESATS